MKASFFERLVAYFIDIVIVTAAVLVIASFVPTPDTKGLQEQVDNISNNYISGDISTQAYITEVSNLYYQIDSKTMLISIIGVFITILYFMYYQFRNDGRTLGKQIMKIKIVKNNGELELNDIVVRSLLIDSILCSMILLLIVFVTNKDIYFLVKSSVEGLQFIFVMVAAFMILFRNDKRGIHDIITDTSVISYREEVQA